MHSKSKIMKIKIDKESEIGKAAREFLQAAGQRRHIAFHAPMGAGKTTFIAAICRELGVGDDVSSPTFSIINEYLDHTGNPVYHFDFYRIDDDRQAMDLGLEEYFDSDSLCLMEWPENVDGFLPDDTLRVRIDVDDDGTRHIHF